MTESNTQLNQLADQLYERYGKPLEAEHWGEFVAISEDGDTFLGFSRNTVMQLAEKSTTKRCFVFKVGDIAVGHIR